VGFLDRFRRSSPDPGDVLRQTLLVPTPDVGAPVGPDREISVLLVEDDDDFHVLDGELLDAARENGVALLRRD
jgi:hypothetical protein